MNTRRYHGLLVAATKPPVERFVLLSKLEESLILNGQRHDLSANRYPGVIHPEGYRYLKEFRLDPFPIFTYAVGGIELRKSVFMIYGMNSTVILYEWETGVDAHLELRPLIAFRDYHGTTHENTAINRNYTSENGAVVMTPYSGLPSLYLAHNGARVEPSGHWYHNFEYEVERERGLDFREDLFQPVVMFFDLSGRKGAAVIASTTEQSAESVDEFLQKERNRRETVILPSPSSDELVEGLTAAADQYIVVRGQGKSVIAGYHWFSDWGRDTMISLPGLTLTTKRFDAAKSILLSFSKFVDRGMLPNRFPDAGEIPEYNTVDATLWYFEAARALAELSGDSEWIGKYLYEALVEIVEWHLHGTRYGIHVEPDGLLVAGEPGLQLTWMDARVGDRVITPRHGKPVEIQALWYNALRTMEVFAAMLGHESGQRQHRELAERAYSSFNQLFWNESVGCLYDVIHHETRDASIRPNQIFAVSLHHSILAPERAKSVVAVVERELLTPLGLRSLSPQDPQYCGRYEGDSQSRDSAYHQGTVWAWLMGPFIEAYLKAYGASEDNRKRAKEWLRGFEGHLKEAGLGQVSEIFDGDPPHHPRGCIAQAWSVAELLRVAAKLF